MNNIEHDLFKQLSSTRNQPTKAVCSVAERRSGGCSKDAHHMFWCVYTNEVLAIGIYFPFVCLSRTNAHRYDAYHDRYNRYHLVYVDV